MGLIFNELSIEEAELLMKTLKEHRKKQEASAKGGTTPKGGG